MPNTYGATGYPQARQVGPWAHGEQTRMTLAQAPASITDLFFAIESGDDIKAEALCRSLSATAINETLGRSATPVLLHMTERVANQARLDTLLRVALERGANPSACDRDGMTPLLNLLFRRDHPFEAATLLLRRKASVRRVDPRQPSPLHVVLRHWRGHAQHELLAMLLVRNADIFEAAPNGESPLWLAASAPGGASVVAKLLAACPEQRLQELVCGEVPVGEGGRGDVATAALLHQQDPSEVEDILLQLARLGVNLRDAESRACALIGSRTIDRDYQGFHDRVATVLQRLHKPSAQLQGAIRAQAPRIVLQPPSIEAKAPAILLRPLPLAPVQAAPRPLPRVVPMAMPMPPAPAAAADFLVRRSQGDEHLDSGTSPDEAISFPPQKLFVANGTFMPELRPQASASVAISQTAHKPQRKQVAPKAIQVAAQHDGRFDTLSLHEVALHGPFEAFERVLSLRPRALLERDHLKNGGHLPLTLAVMSCESRHVTFVVEALRNIDQLRSEILDRVGRDGRSALAVAIDLNGQRQVQQLLQAGASPTRAIPERKQGFLEGVRTLMSHNTAANAAEHAVRRCRPYILTLLLQWDELESKKTRGPFIFNVADLSALAQSLGKEIYTSPLRAVLEDSRNRRRAKRT